MRAAKGDKIKLHDLERRGDFVSAYLSARQRLPPLLLDLSRNGGTLWVVSTGGPQSVVPLCEIKIVNGLPRLYRAEENSDAGLLHMEGLHLLPFRRSLMHFAPRCQSVSSVHVSPPSVLVCLCK